MFHSLGGASGFRRLGVLPGPSGCGDCYRLFHLAVHDH